MNPQPHDYDLLAASLSYYNSLEERNSSLNGEKRGRKKIQNAKQGLLRLSRNKPFSNQHPSVLATGAE